MVARLSTRLRLDYLSPEPAVDKVIPVRGASAGEHTGRRRYSHPISAIHYSVQARRAAKKRGIGEGGEERKEAQD